MSRWTKLFGSPTNTAHTIIDKDILFDLLDGCANCPKASAECYEPNGECAMNNVDSVLEWLAGEGDE